MTPYRITRRAFNAALPGVCGAAPWKTGAAPAPCRFLHATVEGEGTPVPVAGFIEHAIPPDSKNGVLLRWPAEVRGAAGFGFAFGHDYREFGKIAVHLAGSGRLIASVDVSLAPRFDPYYVPLSDPDARTASREGLLLRAEGGDARRSVLSAGPARRREAPALHPFLLIPGKLRPLDEYFHRMRSLDVTQEFDWRAGCVTEGLYALGELKALRRYLDLFLRESSEEATASFRRGVEQTLPAAAIARVMSSHPAIEDALSLWSKRRNASGHVQGGTRIVAEANYTVAYPMAVIGAVRGDGALREQAVLQLRAARDRLVDTAGNLFLRHDESTGERTYLGWARGVAWYILGLAATLDALPDAERPPDLLEELRRSLRWALQFQRDDGLWCAFLPESDVAPDTSGSAGIGAALRIARKLRAAEPSWEQAARRALQGCLGRLSPHGFLTGVSQSNKREGGESFQRSPHRVSMQFGMGLLGAFLANSPSV
ncbi:MAG: glycoside hydrolase family 88 protein [Bryobacteraceae bacterium]